MKVKDKKVMAKMKKETKRAMAHVALLEKLYLKSVKETNKTS